MSSAFLYLSHNTEKMFFQLNFFKLKKKREDESEREIQVDVVLANVVWEMFYEEG